MADTFTAGTLGRIRVGSNTVVAGITRWTLVKNVAVIETPHAEVTADADGTFWVPTIAGGWGRATGTLEGWWNSDSVNQTDGSTIGLTPGTAVTLDLIIVRATPHGFSNLAVRLHSLRIEVPIVASESSRFTAEFTCNGDPGKATTVT